MSGRGGAPDLQPFIKTSFVGGIQRFIRLKYQTLEVGQCCGAQHGRGIDFLGLKSAVAVGVDTGRHPCAAERAGRSGRDGFQVDQGQSAVLTVTDHLGAVDFRCVEHAIGVFVDAAFDTYTAVRTFFPGRDNLCGPGQNRGDAGIGRLATAGEKNDKECDCEGQEPSSGSRMGVR